MTIFVGKNGQGKTNLVEAIEFLSSLSSHRVAQTAPLIKAGASQAIIQARVQAGLDDPRLLTLEVELNSGKPNQAKINRAILDRTRDLIGVLRTVVFSPEDLAIIKGDPADRRNFLDSLVITRWPRMAGVKADYDRVLKQRNALLKSLSMPGVEDDGISLDIWTDQLAEIGGELLSARLDTLVQLMPHVATAYEKIAPTNNQVTAAYQSPLDISGSGDAMPSSDELTVRLKESFTADRQAEISRGHTLSGPHRDDITLNIGQLPAKGFASHGESWSLALALKLGGFSLLREDSIEPVLVLDDVFSELDAERRQRLTDGVLNAEQVLVTAAVPEDLPKELVGTVFEVEAGEVTRVE